MSGPFELGPALLFCPAARPDRFARALDRADAVICDLEDAVAPDRREAAREAVRTAELDPERTIVRINPLGTDDADADLEMLAGTGLRRIMVPKADPATITGVPGGFEVIALCETAVGVAAAAELARAEGVVALMWGAEDLVASLGGMTSRRPDGVYRDVARVARANVLLAAGAAGLAAIDTVHLDIGDLDGLRSEAEDAAASGFAASACIHPTQVPVIRAAYAPPPAALERAHALLDEAARHEAVFRFGGGMVDAPVLQQARTLVERAARADHATRQRSTR